MERSVKNIQQSSAIPKTTTTSVTTTKVPDYQKEITSFFQDFNSSPSGLSVAQAAENLIKFGPNQLQEQQATPLWKLFLATFKDAMVLVLLGVAAIQIIMGQPFESLVILTVLLLNSVVSVVQTKKAESSLAALKELSTPMAKVLRGGTSLVIEAKEIIPGDVVLLDAGDFVPADGRLLSASALRVDEGMLTGESLPTEKREAVITKEVPLGDRMNMVHAGTLVVAGRGTFIVTQTGNHTELGQVASLLATATTKATPLQNNLNTFSQKLGLGILSLSAFIFAVQLTRIYFSGGTDLWANILGAFMFAVAVAVAAIPEALKSIVTIVLSLGTKKMAKQNAIIRKLDAVETLGATSIICTDKTGTLTQNKMTVAEEFLLGNSADLAKLLEVAILTNDAKHGENEEMIGDPTEIALVNFGETQGVATQALQQEFPRLQEIPFDSTRKLMSTLHEFDGEKVLLTKGAPDVVLSRSTHVLIAGKKVLLTPERRAQFQQKNEEFAHKALRVLAFACKGNPAEKISVADEDDFTLIGLLGLVDPPRPEVPAAIAKAQAAGIRPIMITGDHKTTAQAIAKEIGLFQEGDLALTGSELDALSNEELREKLTQISVYARVSPENKIRIVQAWQKKERVCAMTGDGVNDAPALKQADIGIAMGSGTEVAKDAAAMVLTDDNFVSIVQAVEVGRNVFDNIKKAAAYLFAGNLGAILTILWALIFNWANPFSALQLLFINLVNDSVPAIALGTEKAEPHIMKRAPRNPKISLFSGSTLLAVLYRGILISAAVIFAKYLGMQESAEIGAAMSFCTLLLTRTLQIFPARSNTQTTFAAGIFSNKAVLGALVFCSVLFALTLTPALRPLFLIPTSFTGAHLILCLSLALGAVVLMEVTKIILQKKTK